MTAIVKIFTYKGMTSLKKISETNHNDDGVFVVKEPYIGSEKVTVESTAISSTAATAGTGTNVVRVQVEDGKKVAYEVNAGSRAVDASVDTSPVITGENYIECAEGATLSFIEIT